MQKKLLIAGIVLLVGLLSWLLLAWQPVSEHRQIAGLTEAPQGGDFTLQGPDGDVSLADYRGQVVLLYFGYTWCPDICPTSLALFSTVMHELTPEELSKVQPIFVSVDPPRDTIERLQEYTEYFHEKLLGVTGSASAVATAAGRYGVAYRAVDPGPDGNYAVDHSADTYLIDPDGKLVMRLPHGTTAEMLLARVREQLSGESEDKSG